MKYVIYLEMSEALSTEICEIYPQVFGSFNKDKFFDRFNYHKKFMLLMAYKKGVPVAFKFGYALDKETFYSWSGGVIPSERRQGIAAELMRRQHEWCMENKYKFIETKSRNKFPEMLSLNIKHGFKIIGTFTEMDGAPKIIFKKELT